MPRTFNDSLQGDLEATFFNTDEFAGSVTISRGKIKTTGVAAIVAERDYDLAPSRGGMATAFRAVDFDILATKYQLLGQQTDPQEGDQLTAANGEVFRVLLVAGKQCFQHVDGNALILRVHTKRIARG